MNHPHRSSILIAGPVFFVMAVFATGCRTDSVASTSIEHELTSAQVRAAFVRAGLSVSDPVVDARGVISLAIGTLGDSPSEHPLLRAFVYPNVDIAMALRQQALSEDVASRGPVMLNSADRGPQLLTGYGLSTWRNNVALVQAASADDTGAWPFEVDCALAIPAQVAPVPRTVVDPAFIATLESVLDSGAL
jgi:hypothetical protein